HPETALSEAPQPPDGLLPPPRNCPAPRTGSAYLYATPCLPGGGLVPRGCLWLLCEVRMQPRGCLWLLCEVRMQPRGCLWLLCEVRMQPRGCLWLLCEVRMQPPGRLWLLGGGGMQPRGRFTARGSPRDALLL